jgi:hypothetical protein
MRSQEAAKEIISALIYERHTNKPGHTSLDMEEKTADGQGNAPANKLGDIPMQIVLHLRFGRTHGKEGTVRGPPMERWDVKSCLFRSCEVLKDRPYHDVRWRRGFSCLGEARFGLETANSLCQIHKAFQACKHARSCCTIYCYLVSHWRTLVPRISNHVLEGSYA